MVSPSRSTYSRVAITWQESRVFETRSRRWRASCCDQGDTCSAYVSTCYDAEQRLGRRGQTKVTEDKLIESSNLQSRSAELAVLYLFNSYTFDLTNLECLLQGSYSSLIHGSCSLSFSKFSYRDIAPRVDLEPLGTGADLKTFDIHRARIPTDIFNRRGY
jgi:hypothetical protein